MNTRYKNVRAECFTRENGNRYVAKAAIAVVKRRIDLAARIQHDLPSLSISSSMIVDEARKEGVRIDIGGTTKACAGRKAATRAIEAAAVFMVEKDSQEMEMRNQTVRHKYTIVRKSLCRKVARRKSSHKIPLEGEDVDANRWPICSLTSVRSEIMEHRLSPVLSTKHVSCRVL